MDACTPIDDVRGTAQYRKYMVRNMTRQAVSDVWNAYQSYKNLWRNSYVFAQNYINGQWDASSRSDVPSQMTFCTMLREKLSPDRHQERLHRG